MRGEEEGEEMDKWVKRKGKVFRKVDVANWVYLRDGICRDEDVFFSSFFLSLFFPKKKSILLYP